MMRVIDAVLDSFSDLFRSHRYSPVEKLYSVFLFTAGLSLRDLSERLSLTGAFRESVRIWVHRFSSLFKPSKRARRVPRRVGNCNYKSGPISSPHYFNSAASRLEAHEVRPSGEPHPDGQVLGPD
jgi:hypothetical protein